MIHRDERQQPAPSSEVEHDLINNFDRPLERKVVTHNAITI